MSAKKPSLREYVYYPCDDCKQTGIKKVTGSLGQTIIKKCKYCRGLKNIYWQHGRQIFPDKELRIQIKKYLK